MKYCKNCHVHYDTDLEHCLFCNNELIEDQDKPTYYKFSLIQKKPKAQFFYRLFIFLNIISALVSIYVDYLGSSQLSWSWVVAVTNGYIMVMFLMMWPASPWTSRISKIMVVSGLTIILLGLAINDYGWAVDYVFPLTLLMNMLLLSILIIFNRKKWFEYFGNLLIMSIIGLVPGLFNLLNITTVTWPSSASFTYAVVTLLGIFILPSKSSREEFKRRFHI
ncbi:MAG: DUF6320 domain-containing protein [Acholeplasmataceae bacterium]|nr:hypothetical protein [Acholeplasmataceae bacterium]